MKEDHPQIKNIRTGRTKTPIVSYGRFLVLSYILIACSSKQELLNQKNYEGSIMRIDNATTLISDSAKVIINQFALQEEVYENEDREWKKGLFLKYYDGLGQVSSTFKANYVYYTKKDNLYKGVGDVIVVNVTTGDELNTEELFWDPQSKQFYTERYVTIQSEDEIHTGEGLTANQDFSAYTIYKPSGTIAKPEESITDQ